MRQLAAGLAIAALAVTGCAATATTSSGKTPTAVISHSVSAASGTSGTATTGTGLGGLTSNGGLAQWVVDGTFETKARPARPLSGVVTFHDKTTGHTASVTVGASGKFSLGLVAGTYTATARTTSSHSPCSAQVTVTVRAGHLTRAALVCQA
jgi:hypothetical protein